MIDYFEKKQSLKSKLKLSFILSFLFLALAILFDGGNTFDLLDSTRRLNMILLFQALCFCVFVALSFYGKEFTFSDFSMCAILIIASLLIRIACLDFQSHDYYTFLKPWVQYYKENNGFYAIKNKLGDYNVTYLYYLAAISYIDIDELYLIKYLSIVFDFVLAFYCMKLVKVFFDNKTKELITFFVILFLPTVWLNGAYWGQCDSIYATFAIIGLYYGVKSRPIMCVSFMAISFAFKLQAVFIIPILIVLFIIGNLKTLHFIVFPIVYFLTILPALLLDKPIQDILTVYTSQANSYVSYLSYNAPSIFSLLQGEVEVNVFKNIGILVAFSFVLFSFWIILKYRSKFDKLLLLLFALLYVIAIPWLLPFMHERYFFIADVLSFTTIIILGKLYLIPILVFAASYSGYHAYLNRVYIFDYKYPSIGLFICILLLLSEIFKRIGNKKIPLVENTVSLKNNIILEDTEIVSLEIPFIEIIEDDFSI